MPTRRTFLTAMGLGAGLALVGGHSLTFCDPTPGFRAPAEGGPHKATWMAYGATASAWGTQGAFGAMRAVAREDLIRIAATLARFEPVHMLVTNRSDLKEARRLLARTVAATDPKNKAILAAGAPRTAGDARMRTSRALPPPNPEGVTFHLCRINDLWTRDIAPVFVRHASTGKVHGVDFNFNGWGQEPVRTGLEGWRRDADKVRNGIADQRVVEDMRVAKWILDRTSTPRGATWLTLEGGAVEVNGHGLAVMAESCVLNPNRNPGRSRAEIEDELRRVMGIEHVLWVPGVRALDITDGHIDFYARFARPDTILLNWDGGYEDDEARSVDGQNFDALERAVARFEEASASTRRRLLGGSNRGIRIQKLRAPRLDRVRTAVAERTSVMRKRAPVDEDTFAGGYVGYYEANGVVLMAGFGDVERDAAAYEALVALYPERTVVQMTTDGLAGGGGTIHCATQQQIRQ